MSGYGRRAPNVSQYLADLNHIPSQHEMHQQSTELPPIDHELDFLANTEFFDFDQFAPQPFDPQQPAPDPKNASHYQFSDFPTFPPTSHTSPTNSATSPTNLHGQYPPQPHHFGPSPNVGDKRKASVAIQSAADLEEASRVAAEEDKRRRNTAASARFRVKKKQREQALELATKEMTDKVTMLEGKVRQLETENKWLKELITEKSDVKTLDAALEVKREKESDERSTGSRTDGVGT